MTLGSHKGAPIFGCRGCHGVWFPPGILRFLHQAESDLPELRHPLLSRGGRRFCPDCRLQLDQRPFLEGEDVIVDVCSGCDGVFLDRREFRETARVRRRLKALGDPVSAPRAPDGLAPDGQPVDEVARQMLEYYQQAHEGSLDAKSWLMQFFLGIPKELNLPPLRTPWVTYGLIVGNVLCFLWMIRMSLTAQEGAYLQLLFDPGAPTAYTAVTSAFLHANLAHLFGNMLMLYITGDNVEDHLGPLRFLGFYLGGALAAAALHATAVGPGGPSVLGASGAIAAVLAAYVLACPRARISVMLFLLQFSIPFPVFIVGWLILHAVMIEAGVGGIAWWAHLGGFAFGFVAFLIYRYWLYKRTGIEVGA